MVELVETSGRVKKNGRVIMYPGLDKSVWD